MLKFFGPFEDHAKGIDFATLNREFIIIQDKHALETIVVEDTELHGFEMQLGDKVGGFIIEEILPDPAKQPDAIIVLGKPVDGGASIKIRIYLR